MCRKHENMKTMVLMLLVILELFCCLHVSEGIRCYECNSLITPECGEPFKMDFTKMDTCEDNSKDAVCYKVRRPPSGQFVLYFCDIYLNFCNSVYTPQRAVCYRPSVFLSVTRVNQSKTVEVRITHPSPQSSPMTPVSWRLMSPRNSKRKRCKIGPTSLLMTNRKSHLRFRLVPKSSTLDDLELL